MFFSIVSYCKHIGKSVKNEYGLKKDGVPAFEAPREKQRNQHARSVDFFDLLPVMPMSAFYTPLNLIIVKIPYNIHSI
jgi:hypothetical protein